MTDETTPDTLGDALPREMARVRDEVMPAYLAIGPAGSFALIFRAAKAMAEGDAVAMLHAYQKLKEYHT